MIIPVPEKLTNERASDILNALEEFILKRDFSQDDNKIQKTINEILHRLTLTSYELYDFVRLESILNLVCNLLNDDIVDTLCIILLRGINFNLSYYIHKYNIHEKQNIKIQYINMDEAVAMPTLKAYLCRHIPERKLGSDMRSIRFFITYHILYKKEIQTSMSLENLLIASRFSSSNIETTLDETNLSSNKSSKGWKSEADLSNTNKRFVYSGDHEVFYLLEYLMTGNSNILTKWLINGTIPCDWTSLGLPPMANFIVNELRFVKDISFIYSIILQSRSHDLLSKFLVKILYRIGYNHTLHVLILSSFDPSKIEDTIYLLKRLYMEDREKTNNVLRDLVVAYKPEELKSFFLSECRISPRGTNRFVDKNFIECIKIYLTSLGDFSREDLRNIMSSEYFHSLLDDKEDFYYVLNVYSEKNLMDEIIPIVHKMKWEMTEDNFDKLKFLFSNFEIDEDLFFGIVDCMIKKMYRIHRSVCKESHGESIPYSTPAYVPISLDKNSCSLLDFSTTINVVHPQYKEEKDTKGFKRPEKSYKSELISNASTLAEIKEISEYNNKYKIKKEKKEKCSQSIIRAIMDFVFIFRHQDLDIKKIYKLNPQGFIERLLEVSSGDLDVFFVKAMNVVLSSDQNESILDQLLPISKDDDYWNVAVRRNLRMRSVKITQPKKENKKVYLITDSALRESYLDLSQINESKIVLESKIDQSIIKILEDRTLYSLLKRNESTFIKDELTNRRKIPSGLSMKNSSISFPVDFSSFTLNMKVYQFDTSGIQNIVEIIGKSKTLKIGTINGKLFQETIKAGITERKLVEHESTFREYMYLEMSYSYKNLKISINSKNYKVEINKVERIVIGRLFKGVINKILLFESVGYRNCRIVNLNGSYLYIKVLHKLERYLKYHNLKGVYLDSTHPYFFNGKLDIKWKNVL